MVYTMKKLDTAGIFFLNQPREQVYINVELMPPDDTDIERALSFNNPDNIGEWLGIFSRCFIYGIFKAFAYISEL